MPAKASDTKNNAAKPAKPVNEKVKKKSVETSGKRGSKAQEERRVIGCL
jgi:hypothetical protein